jgi:uncharacterized membrane protein YadS
MGKWLDIEKKTSYLISAGTAICGGSAIATISTVIKAEEKQISVAVYIKLYSFIYLSSNRASF